MIFHNRLHKVHQLFITHQNSQHPGIVKKNQIITTLKIIRKNRCVNIVAHLYNIVVGFKRTNVVVDSLEVAARRGKKKNYRVVVKKEKKMK